MKKTFTLVLMSLFLLMGGVNAQNYRKWDFTNWSAMTIANLKADAAASSTVGWSDIEKAADAGEGKVAPDATRDKCFWYDSSEDGELKANGVVIAELAGLQFGSAYGDNRSLAIAVDYPETSLGTYAGPQYLWLGGGNKAAGSRLLCFTIPKVKIGQKITMVAESHKPSEARGVSIFVKDVNVDANQIGESFTPKTQETYTWENWTLPAGIEDEDNDGMVDILVYNTNGCHIYSIEVGDADQKSKIAYLYQGTPDATQAIAESIANYEVEAIDITAVTKTAEELRDYDAVVIAANVNDAAYAAELKNALGWTPIVNTSYGLYELWGLGTASSSDVPFVFIKAEGHSLFNGVDVVEDPDTGRKGIEINGEVYGIQNLNSYFANDDILGTDFSEALTTVHLHNAGHNSYVYIPAGNEQLTINAIKAVANSKSEVTAAPKPSIKFEYGNMKTKVLISSTVPGAKIYYTIDGSDPTEANVYTEPFWVETEVTVKAKVEGDGYTLSDVAEAKVDLKQQAAKPSITVSQAPGAAYVTLSCATEGVDIFYNYDANSDSTKSTKYTGPITIMKGRELTAFAATQAYVASELNTQTITVDTPMPFTEVLAHMDANKEEYYDAPIATGQSTVNDSKVAYFFSWGKTKGQYPYYDTTADPIGTTIDPETGDEVNVYPMNPEEVCDLQNGWGVRSRGHIICTEITIKPGKDVGVGSTYNPATVDEFEFTEEYPRTDIYLNIGEWNTADPRSGMIYSTKKFKGPFAVLSYISNGNGGTGPKVVFETGTDIEGDAVETEWTQFGDTCVLNQGQRLYKKFVRLYTGSDEVYLRTRIAADGSKAGFYDIYVLGVDPAFITGIEEVNAEQETATKQAAIYSLSGTRQNALRHGLNIVVDEKGKAKKVVVK